MYAHIWEFSLFALITCPLDWWSENIQNTHYHVCFSSDFCTRDFFCKIVDIYWDSVLCTFKVKISNILIFLKKFIKKFLYHLHYLNFLPLSPVLTSQGLILSLSCTKNFANHQSKISFNQAKIQAQIRIAATSSKKCWDAKYCALVWMFTVKKDSE